MKLFLASFAIVTACSFAFCVANPGGMDFAANSGPTNTPQQSDLPIVSYPVDYSICDSYCKLANDQLLAIRAGANYSVTYVSVSIDTTLTPIIGVK